jgi:3-oxoacyl-[acyl-carrier protein] reductase
MASGNGWVVVAGAGGALGSDFVRHYMQQGRSVLALDLNIDAIPQTDAVKALAVDLASADAVEAALDQISRPQAIDVLVNAVGMIWNEPVVAMKGARLVAHSSSTFANVISANLTAAFVVATRVAARMVRHGGGAIVNFSSLSANGIAGQAAYSAAKAGVIGMTRAMATELGPLSVRVNAIAPGFVDVSSTRAALSESKIAEYVAHTPVGRLGSVEELIAAVEFLANSPFINGAVLPIDGGIRV